MYTLRFPFELPSGQAISGECRIELGDLVILITQEGKRYLVTVEGLESEQAAQGYVAKLWAALMWVLLNKKLAVQADTHLQQISWRPANSHEFMGIPIDDDIDGAIDDSRPGVYPSGKRFLKMGINPATVMITTSASHVGQILLEGLSFPKSGNVLANSKLKVALELYVAYWMETSQNAKLLTLVMALEALATRDLWPPRILALLDHWKNQLEEFEQQGDLEPQESAALDSLKQDLTFQKRGSIRSQIRALVYTALRMNGDVDATEMSRQAVRVYDQRSRLIHEGELSASELSSASSIALTIVERVLKAKFRLTACD